MSSVTQNDQLLNISQTMQKQVGVEELEWELDFHGNDYIVNLTADDTIISLEIENSTSNERWSGEFTSQYIEEITQKAGNFKKFPVFVKMLISAFSKDNERVFIDLLSHSDLEILKAKKFGNNSNTNSSNNNIDFKTKQNLKKYAILTYSGEFDKVHYPLPLAFEDTPNYSALQRTIQRLRDKLKSALNGNDNSPNDKEKELRQIISQLRQDNTELRHRLRNLKSPLKASPITSAGVNAELAAANTKLRKQIEALKKELHDSSLGYNKLRIESAKEVMKWKQKIGLTGSQLENLSNKGNESHIISELRKKLLIAEKELRFERLSRLSASRPSTSRYGTPTSNTLNNFATARVPSNSNRSLSTGTFTARRSVSSDQTLKRGNYQDYSRNISPNMPSTTTRNGLNNKNYSEKMNNDRRTKTPVSDTSRHNSPSSSSLGRRFDPTAYQNDKIRREMLLKNSKLNRSQRYSSPGGSRESGYASANSQSSAGSRGSTSRMSRKSDSSANSSRRSRKSHSNGMHSDGSDIDQQYKKTKSLKKKKKRIENLKFSERNNTTLTRSILVNDSREKYPSLRQQSADHHRNLSRSSRENHSDSDHDVEFDTSSSLRLNHTTKHQTHNNNNNNIVQPLYSGRVKDDSDNNSYDNNNNNNNSNITFLNDFNKTDYTNNSSNTKTFSISSEIKRRTPISQKYNNDENYDNIRDSVNNSSKESLYDIKQVTISKNNSASKLSSTSSPWSGKNGNINNKNNNSNNNDTKLHNIGLEDGEKMKLNNNNNNNNNISSNKMNIQMMKNRSNIDIMQDAFKENSVNNSMVSDDNDHDLFMARRSGGGLSNATGSVNTSINSMKSKINSNINATDEELSEIDKRIQALQTYLDNARAGIMSTSVNNTK
eukprot:gene7211-9841_t